MNLIDTGDIARMLGITREHVTDKMTKRPDFPRPVVNINRRLRRWEREDVEQWMRGRDADQSSRAAMSSEETR